VKYSYQYLTRIAQEFASKNTKNKSGTGTKIGHLLNSMAVNNTNGTTTNTNSNDPSTSTSNINAQVLLMVTQIEKTYVEGLQVQ